MTTFAAARVRVYDLASQLHTTSREIIAFLPTVGLRGVTSPFSTLTGDAAQHVVDCWPDPSAADPNPAPKLDADSGEGGDATVETAPKKAKKVRSDAHTGTHAKHKKGKHKKGKHTKGKDHGKKGRRPHRHDAETAKKHRKGKGRKH